MDDIKQWIQRRVEAINKIYTAFEVLSEIGVELVDKNTDFQIPCPLPGHGPDNRPSARYYGSSHEPHFHCFKCKVTCDGINLYARLRGLRFMDALQSLERRFHIKTPQRPEGPDIVEPTDRESKYISDQWKDVPRMLKLLEGKLARVKPKCSLSDYTKFCRVLDAVQWDFDKVNKSTDAMSDVTKKLMGMMDEILSLPEDLTFSDLS
jgi:CHC2 zinc finger